MFIHAGLNSSKLYTENLYNEKCINCGTKDSIDITVKGRYFHLYWIPFFPVSRICLSECRNCKQVLEKKKVPDNYMRTFYAIKNIPKTPLWHYSGLLIALVIGAFLFVYLTFYMIGSEDRKHNYLSAPMKGDIYEYRIDKKEYSTVKIEQVTKDSVFLRYNCFDTKNIFKIDEIDKVENYNPVLEIISRKELVAKFSKIDYLNVKRE